MSHFGINQEIIGLRAGERHVLMRFIREYLRGRLLTSPLRVFPVHNRLCCCSLLACCPLSFICHQRGDRHAFFIFPLFLTVKLALFCKSSPRFPHLQSAWTQKGRGKRRNIHRRFLQSQPVIINMCYFMRNTVFFSSCEQQYSPLEGIFISDFQRNESKFQQTLVLIYRWSYIVKYLLLYW